MKASKEHKENMSRSFSSDIVKQRIKNNNCFISANNPIQRVRTYAIDELTLFGRPKRTFLRGNAIALHSRYVYNGDINSGFGELHEILNSGGPINPLNNNETLILVSHGSEPTSISRSKFGIASFATLYTPERLADILNYQMRLFPNGYTGEIYLDGCYTALGETESFAYRFKQALFNINHNLGAFRVTGNLGTAITSNATGQEYIEFSRKNMHLIQGQVSAQILMGNMNPARFVGNYLVGDASKKSY